ncbi:LPS assembly lipoprotein LptE [Spectribacter hydrogenooxidans]|uniref:LPS-assembly lipoprotein LptE n=1 Tax=Spectribacter hydrogenoxidans TaxID=3075608 RepID=A0ABU3C3I4_9GAMM|nr:LPS assembly lipoprotein LptE [Salinisphaera sp. W335]MDT0636082.1 hypothetical protein [Salinisphaera sp. W335]
MPIPMRAGVLLLTLWLSACGFHMAGSVAGSGLDGLQVEYEQRYRVLPPPLIDVLRERTGGGDGQASARLVIRGIDDTRRVLSVSPQDGRANAFELISEASFDLIRDGETLLRDQQVSTQRDVGFDDSRRLAADAESRDLRAAMHAELADLILLRVETALAP